MDPILIVEGKADEKFLQDFVKVRFRIELRESSFIVTGGNSLRKDRSSILANNTRGIKQLVIFDSDKSVENTRTQITSEAKELGLEIQGQFYFPNNADPGNLETLLRTAINPDCQGVLDCIDQYGHCLRVKPVPGLRPFDEKSKVYIYVDSFEAGGSGKEDGRDYTEPRLWNLNSESLQPLHDFLSPYFPPEA